MNKAYRFLMFAATAAFALTSCTSDDAADEGATQIRLTSAVVGAQSRATYKLDTRIKSGQEVDVWVDDAGTSDALYENNTFTVGDDGTLTKGAPMFFPTTGNAVNIYALHTNATLDGNAFPETISHTVSNDQASEDGYATSDLLYAESNSVKRTSDAVTLTFSHILSKVELTIKKGNGDDAGIANAKIASVSLENLLLGAGTTLSKGKTPKVEASGDAASIALTADDYAADLSDDGVAYEAIIVPQTVAANTNLIKITLLTGEEFFYALPEATAFESGNKYSYTVNVTQTGLTVTAKVTNWNEGSATDVTINRHLPAIDFDQLSVDDLTKELIVANIKDGVLKVTGTYSAEKLKAVTSHIKNNESCTTIDLSSVTDMKEVPSISFYGCQYLQTIKLPNTINEIGDYAFGKCFSLTNIEGLESVTNVVSFAFYRCESLDSISLPEATSIDRYAFEYCTKLVYVDIPKANTIYSSVFERSGVKEINLLSSSFYYLDSSSFYGLSGCTLYLHSDQSNNINNGVWTVNDNRITLSNYFSAVYCGNTLVYGTPKTE